MYRLFHWKLPGRFGVATIVALRFWPFSLALAIWTPKIEDWRIYSLGPDPFV